MKHDYLLKFVKKDMRSDFDPNFKYPKRGWVEAKDWNDDNNCGGGIHGQLNAAGSHNASFYGEVPIVIKFKKEDGFVDLGGKCKIRKGYVVGVFDCGQSAVAYINKHLKENSINLVQQFSVISQGDYSTANQGSCSTAKQRYNSTANQGDYSTANQWDCSTANQGSYSTSNQGSYSTANQWDCSTANQGGYSTANQWDCSTANQGSCSTATYQHTNNFVYRNTSDLCAIVFFYDEKVNIFVGGKDLHANETAYVDNGKITHRYSYTPNNISELRDHEVFVFGSNKAGKHGGGAARLAADKFGAVDGVGEGLNGNSYALPTLGDSLEQLTGDELKSYVETLNRVCCKETRKIFFITKVGCGIAGYDEDFIKGILEEFRWPANAILPKDWEDVR